MPGPLAEVGGQLERSSARSADRTMAAYGALGAGIGEGLAGGVEAYNRQRNIQADLEISQEATRARTEIERSNLELRATQGRVRATQAQQKIQALRTKLALTAEGLQIQQMKAQTEQMKAQAKLAAWQAQQQMGETFGPQAGPGTPLPGTPAGPAGRMLPGMAAAVLGGRGGARYDMTRLIGKVLQDARGYYRMLPGPNGMPTREYLTGQALQDYRAERDREQRLEEAQLKIKEKEATGAAKTTLSALVQLMDGLTDDDPLKAIVRDRIDSMLRGSGSSAPQEPKAPASDMELLRQAFREAMKGK